VDESARGSGVQEALGLVSTKVFLIALIWGLGEYIAGAIAGARVYKEA
jgi:hypothetical protein